MTIDTAEYLVGKDLAMPRYSRKGQIVELRFYERSLTPPNIAVRVKTGTKLTHREWFGDHAIIQHNRLPYRQVDAELHHSAPWSVVEDGVRNAFQSVVLSVLQA
jgi:hypothetical protein